jgi:hypothetical protein
VAAAEGRKQTEDILHEKQLLLARVQWQNHQFDQARATLLACDPARRDREWRYLQRVLHAQLWQREENVRSSEVPMVFDAKGERLAVLITKGIKILDVGSGRELLFHPGFLDQVAFQAGKNRLVVVGQWGLPGNKPLQNAVSVCDLPGGARVGGILYKSPWPWRWLSPRGDLIAVAQGSPRELLWQDSQDGRVVQNSGPATVTVSSAGAFSADGKRLAVLNRGMETISLWDAPPSSRVRTLDVKAAPGQLLLSTRLCLDASGDRVAVGYMAVQGDPRGPAAPSCGPVKVFDVATGKVTRTLHPHAKPLAALVFCPTGERLATAASDRTIVVWDSRTGQELLTFRVDSETIRWLAFSPDGRRLAAADPKRVWMWDTRPLPAG